VVVSTLIRPRSNHVNIDGDVIVYAAGFAAQTNEYWVNKDVFDSKKDAVTFCERYAIDIEEIEVRIIAEPVEYCLSTVKRMTAGIVEKAGAETYNIILSGKDNFRVKTATIQPYKGQRTAAKPIHFDAIRNYITTVLNCITTVGEEADDYLSYRAVSHNETIATVDKDLNNTEGWHLNWNKDGMYYVDARTADQNFWVQMLTGDSTDNIAGIFKLTGTKASAAMKQEVQSCATYKEMRQCVIETYQRCFEKLANKMGVDFLPDGELYDMLSEIGQLLWMRREPDELWSIDYGC
jgi:hypothetical protein